MYKGHPLPPTQRLALPGDFPKWCTVHSYFQRWSEPRENGISILEKALKNQVVAERRKQGRHEETTFLIIDAQSVRNTDTAMEKGYDAGKKVSGINRYLFIPTVYSRNYEHVLKR